MDQIMEFVLYSKSTAALFYVGAHNVIGTILSKPVRRYHIAQAGSCVIANCIQLWALNQVCIYHNCLENKLSRSVFQRGRLYITRTSMAIPRWHYKCVTHLSIRLTVDLAEELTD